MISAFKSRASAIGRQLAWADGMAKEGMDRMGMTFLRDWDRAGAADNAVKLAAVLSVILLASAFSALPGLPIFGHDEVHYYPDFSQKLAEDGRWLNFLLHDFLRSIPPVIWAGLFLALSWLLFYRMARSITFEAPYAVLIASTILLAYPFAEQALWPATATPSVLIMLLASRLVERGVAYPAVYLLTGALIFGTLPTYYFLLPLFFLGRFLPTGNEGQKRLSLFFSHMLWWMGGCVAGVLALSLVIWPLTGHFGPAPAEWRGANAIEDVDGLIRNFVIVGEYLAVHLERLLRLAGVGGAVALVLALAVLVRFRALLAMRHALLLLAAVFLSFFAFSLPLAPVISQRSLISMMAAFVLLVAFVAGPSAAGRVLGAVLLLSIGHSFSLRDQSFLATHETETTYFYEKLQELIPGHPMTYSAIALYGTMDTSRLEARTFNDPSLMHPIIITLRASRYLDCRIEFRCDGIGSGRQLSALPFAGGQLVFSVDDGNVGIVRYLGSNGK